MARSLNKVMLIGNLTRDPELKYTPSGAAVVTFGIATNRNWTTDAGEKKDVADFHNIVAWNKLAELCSQLLKKGRKVYVEGRLSTQTWKAPDGTNRYRTEVIINDMLILDKKDEMGGAEEVNIPEDNKVEESSDAKAMEDASTPEPSEEDIPF